MPTGETGYTDALPPGNMRTVMLWIAGVVATVGLGALLVYGLAAAFYVMLLAAIPAGIALGTQEKEFYL
jgi:hypothetical protein